MEFYKIVAQTSAFGNVANGEYCIYVYAESLGEAEKQFKAIPFVKKLGAVPLAKFIRIGESEFFDGTIYNPHFDLICKSNVDELTGLDKLAGRLWLLFDSNYKCTTEKGKTIKEYCTKYTVASKKQQKKLCAEFESWAESLFGQLE